MMAETAWPWLTFAALGLFHGLNPAMGWLFAVALGLHRHSRKTVVLAVLPMAAGHALSIWLVAASMMAVGMLVDPAIVRMIAGSALVLWAIYYWAFGHRHRVRIGMTAGLAGLALWSFLMATAHGAGLMLLPALMLLCASATVTANGPLLVSLAAVGLHMMVTLFVTGAVALLVYDWLGLGILRSMWINFDYLWSGALFVTGLAVVLV